MSYKVIPVDKFKREAKRLVKKYPSLKIELAEIAESLSEEPTLGTSLGNDTYKIRISIKSKGKGKSGGYRVTYLHRPESEKIYLIVLYSKNEQEDLSSDEKKFLRKLIETLKEE